MAGLLPDAAWREWLDDSLHELTSSHQLRVLRPLVATSSGVRVRGLSGDARFFFAASVCSLSQHATANS